MFCQGCSVPCSWCFQNKALSLAPTGPSHISLAWAIHSACLTPLTFTQRLWTQEKVELLILLQFPPRLPILQLPGCPPTTPNLRAFSGPAGATPQTPQGLLSWVVFPHPILYSPCPWPCGMWHFIKSKCAMAHLIPKQEAPSEGRRSRNVILPGSESQI